MPDPPRTYIGIHTLFLATRTAWKALVQPILQKPISRFYAEQIIGYATRWSSAEIEVDFETDAQGMVIEEKATERNHNGFVEWSMTNRTDTITVGYDRLEVTVSERYLFAFRVIGEVLASYTD